MADEDDFIKWVKAHYSAGDFIPHNPLIFNIVVKCPEDVALFYLANLLWDGKKLDVKFTKLEVPLWHVEIGDTKRYLLANGEVIIKAKIGGETVYYAERENGLFREEISFVTAEMRILDDLQRKYLYHYLRDVANTLGDLKVAD